jgi:hypothetical protein
LFGRARGFSASPPTNVSTTSESKLEKTSDRPQRLLQVIGGRMVKVLRFLIRALARIVHPFVVGDVAPGDDVADHLAVV